MNDKEMLLGCVLWREACVADAIREGFLRGKSRLTCKGERKLHSLLEDGFKPDVSDRPVDIEQATRIRARLAEA